MIFPLIPHSLPEGAQAMHPSPKPCPLTNTLSLTQTHSEFASTRLVGEDECNRVVCSLPRWCPGRSAFALAVNES